MNPKYGEMLEGSKSADHQSPGPAAKKEQGKHAGHGKPSIHIHSHSGGHTVHILHQDGRHEMHEHPHGDSDGMAEHIHTHLGGGAPESFGSPSGEEVALGER